MEGKEGKTDRIMVRVCHLCGYETAKIGQVFASHIKKRHTDRDKHTYRQTNRQTQTRTNQKKKSVATERMGREKRKKR